jgi:hypothetical protein
MCADGNTDIPFSATNLSVIMDFKNFINPNLLQSAEGGLW